MTNLAQDIQIPDNYEIYFSQVNCEWSIWHTSSKKSKPEIMAEGFKTKEDALKYLLFPCE